MTHEESRPAGHGINLQMPESDKQYPRVLVINAAPFGDSSATGITMDNLFRNWPVERIAQLYVTGEPKHEICQRYWRVTASDVPVDKAVRRLIGARRDRLIGWPSAGMPSGLGKAGSSGRLHARGTMHGIAASWADVFRFRLSGEFWNWVAEFQPDVVYSMLGSIRMMNVVLEVADRVSKPIVPHFMDDWPATHYRATRLSLIPRLILLSRVRSIMRRSPVGMAICQAMAKEYRRRYAIPFEAFMNCVDTPAECPPASPNSGDEPVRLLYLGGLHLNRWRSLQDVGKSLEALTSEGLNVELIVHGPASDVARYGQTLAASPATRVGGSLAPDQVLPALREADVLLHVESFDQDVRKYTRLSLSTKIPQYMSSGRPILGYGPEEVASCRYIQESGCGRVVSTEDAYTLTNALKELVSDAQLRTRLGHQGWERACRRHNSDIERERLRVLLSKAYEQYVCRTER